MRTAEVRRISDEYSEGSLIHPPDIGESVCPLCRTWTSKPSLCATCSTVNDELAGDAADAVVPIGLAVKHHQFARDLWNYKNDVNGSAARAAAVRLACVLCRFLKGHEACVAGAARVGSPNFEIVTMVPSTRRRADGHPLERMLAQWIVPARQRYARSLEPLLKTHDSDPHGRDRYRVTTPVNGSSVLLIDDTWTTGVHARSAADALKAAGAVRVAVIVLGRHINPAFGDHGLRVRDCVRRRPFSWEWCCVHDDP